MSDCACRIDRNANGEVAHLCKKHLAEFEEMGVRAARDKKILDEWDVGPHVDYSRRGTFAYLGGPITWDPQPTSTAASKPREQVEAVGDLTALMTA